MSSVTIVDELYEEVVALVREKDKASTSFLRKQFGIGYTRADRIINSLEDNHIISKLDKNGYRTVLGKFAEALVNEIASRKLIQPNLLVFV